MPVKTLVATGTGSDGKQYTVRITGPAVNITNSMSGAPGEWVFSMKPHRVTVDGYNDAVSHVAPDVFRLDAMGVDVTLDPPFRGRVPGP